MLSVNTQFRRARASLLIFACLLVPTSFAQNQTTPTNPVQDKEETIRISTELVQTDVTVFDKQGKFVEGLRAEDFELKVDGKLQQVAFFERVQAGSPDEDAQLRAARGGSTRTTSAPNANKVRPLDRGRTIYFFVDDVHLSPGSVARARQTLLHFINEEMGQNDEAAIISATGQIGFLQQLTSDKSVLRAAVARINYRPYNVTDNERPRMTEAHAIAVEQNNTNVIEYFVTEIRREMPQLSPEVARNMVNMRAHHIVTLSTHLTRQMFGTLQNLVRRSAAAPGRKIVFFISDGFMMNQSDGDTRERMRRLTDAAARAGVVIYTLDARGLVPGGMTDASTEGNFDPGALLAGAALDEIPQTQQALRTLAGDTGGRALLNTNALERTLAKAIQETSVYYLLAWRPEGGDGRGEKFRRIEVRVKGKPELKVQVRRGFYLMPPSEPDEGRAENKKSAEVAPVENTKTDPLFDALRAYYTSDSLPTSLALTYLNMPNNTMVLTASLEIDDTFLGYREVGGQKRAIADVAGMLFDVNGKLVNTLRQELEIKPPLSDTETRQRVVQSYQFPPLAPGLYQVRFAARDRETGRTGSAWQWVEIPDPKKGFFLSSLFVSERVPSEAAKDEQPTGDPLMRGVNVTANRRFARTSWLRFMLFVYNASRPSAAPPDVVLQIQIFRDDQPVMTTPLRKLDTEQAEDPARIPYAAEIPLETFLVGRYVLQVTAIDRTSKTSASQRVNFSVE